MEFKGTFRLKLINRNKGEIMRQSFRKNMKLIYLGACCAYLSEIIKQVPVLTGASRTAIAWRLDQLILKAQQIDAALTTKFGIANDLVMGNTLRKTAPHVYPEFGWNDKREKWKQSLLANGQTENSWLSNEYVPMIVDMGTGNQVSGKYKFFFAIQNFYLEHYDNGTINDSSWSWGADFPYLTGAWELSKDGQLAFNEEFNRLFNLSGVAGLRNVLSGMPVGGVPEYMGQIEQVGSVEEEELF